MKTSAMVSPGSASTVHVQSALFSYSDGKWGLEMLLLVPRRVPPQAPSAAGTEEGRAVQGGLGHKSACSATGRDRVWVASRHQGSTLLREGAVG